MRNAAVVVLAGVLSCVASPALAQRFEFEESFDVGDGATLDVSTVRGKIDVTVGPRGRVIVAGDVTTRVGLMMPSNAVELARKIAAAPPIVQDGDTLRLRPPAGEAERRAATVRYRVQVPADARVIATSESGATTVRGVGGSVTVRTGSSAISLVDLGGAVDVVTGSGAVDVDGVAGALVARTGSSAFTGRNLQGGVRVRTSSGAVDAALRGAGDVDVETGSSSIRLRGVSRALTIATRSGRVSVEGAPGGDWRVSTGSGSIDLDVGHTAPFDVDASTRSGSITLADVAVDGTISRQELLGSVLGGGPLVHVSTRSGSVRLSR